MARTKNLPRQRTIAVLIGTCVALGACDETAEGGLFGQISSERLSGETIVETRVEERDVERPDIFETTDLALWDGRPSFGGVWVAHPDVTTPERVRVTNTETGKVVEAALFRRERNMPGPLIQLSSDAAAELAAPAGTPVKLSVVVLRREEVVIEEVVPAPPIITEEASTDEIVTEESIEAATAGESPIAPGIDAEPIAEAAAAAIAAADADPEDTANDVNAAEEEPAKPLFPLAKPFIQVGIFSVENNALEAAETLTNAGLEPLLSQDLINDKTFWRVIVGPAINRQQRSELLSTVKNAGFPDAYYIKE